MNLALPLPQVCTCAPEASGFLQRRSSVSPTRQHMPWGVNKVLGQIRLTRIPIDPYSMAALVIPPLLAFGSDIGSVSKNRRSTG